MLSLVVFSCDENIPGDDDENGNGSGGSNNLTTGQIEIKVYPDDNNKVSFYMRAKKIVIDWGDGFTSKPTSTGVIEQIFVHEYATKNIKTIKIDTEELTNFYNYENYYGSCEELKFGNCPDLKEIYCDGNSLKVLNIKKAESLKILSCSYNQLTSLNVSGCTALAGLSCDENQLTSSALNSLFKSLPIRKADEYIEYFLLGISIKVIFISISDNPGASDCDRTFAENKGWSVYF
jgi:Leucine-rich repeat (LRR) protein